MFVMGCSRPKVVEMRAVASSILLKLLKAMAKNGGVNLPESAQKIKKNSKSEKFLKRELQKIVFYLIILTLTLITTMLTHGRKRRSQDGGIGEIG